MLQLILVRHGEHVLQGDGRLVGRAPEVPLSALGRAQAAGLGRAIAHLCPARLLTSPLVRATATAASIAAATGLVAVVAPALDEVDYGAWTGRRPDELAADLDWTRWNARGPAAAIPGGETLALLLARVDGLLKLMLAQPATRPTCLVSHQEVLRLVVLRALGLPPADFWRLGLDPGSWSLVELGDGWGRVRHLNVAAATPP